MIRPFIAANWKMNKTAGEALDFIEGLKKLVAGIGDRQVVIAPPFPSLYQVGAGLKGSEIGLAAQNLSAYRDGAYTGEVSARMLTDAGCTYVIVGHSERRTLFGESNETIGAKLGLAFEFGLRPIFCIGETLQEREDGRTFGVIEKQIKEAMNQVRASDISNMIVAYEPVWAIGTGRTATPEQAQEVHDFIRELMMKNYGQEAVGGIPIIYGGSVNADNIGILMTRQNINGVLVGGASLNVATFIKIVTF
jgi:triosephosphate isomerase